MQALKSEPARFPGEAALLRYRSRLDSAPAHEERSASFAHHDADAVDDFDMDATPHTTASRRRQLQYLATEHDALKDEHRMLQERHDLHVKFQCRAQLLVDSEHPVSVEELFGAQSEARRARVLAELRARCPAQMQRPLDADECHAIGLDIYAKIQAFTENENYASTGGAVCGWEDRRCVEDGLLKFSLQKLFPNLTAHEMAARTWPVLASPAKLRSFYSNNMKMHCEVAQRVDDSNVVLYQEYEASERDPVTGRETDVLVLVRSLLLVTLFQISDGYVMLFYGIDPSRLQERDDVETLASVGVSGRKVWLNKLSWCIWQEAGDAGEHTNSAFVGAVPAEGARSSYWPLEVLLMSMRWEHEVIGPNFILRSEDDPEPAAHKPAPAVSRYSSVRFGSWTQLSTAPHDSGMLVFRESVDKRT